VDTQRATEIQAVLEGIPLPATRRSLVAYARAQDASIADDLARLPDQTYERLDLVGEVLLNGTPEPEARSPLPSAESGEPPGGSDYLTPSPSDTGAVRDDAPPSNPPQKTIQKQSKTQARQKKVQQGG
jgi:hypothetical protein